MRYDSDQLIFSPSDLVVFLESEFASWMDRWRIECSKSPEGMNKELNLPLEVVRQGLACKPDEQDAESRLIASMGMSHESAFLQELLEKGHGVEDIKAAATERQLDATIEAMRNGMDFIYQGRLKLGRFEGLADFLPLCHISSTTISASVQQGQSRQLQNQRGEIEIAGKR